MNSLIILSALGVICLFSEIIGFKKIILPIIFTGLAAALAAIIMDWNGTAQPLFNNMILFDHYSIAFTALLIVVTILWFILFAPSAQPSEHDFFHEPTSRTDHFSLIIFALIGAQLMTSFNNMIMLFLAVEVLSIPMYILAGSNKSKLESNEASFKYFLMGAFATGFLLFGITLIYGATGSFDLSTIAQSLTNPEANSQLSTVHYLLPAGIILILIALAFKASVAPFHFWAPDVYTGSPTVVTAFMSTVVKVGAFAAFFRLFFTCFSASPEIWSNSIWVLAALTILVGNITAVYQTSFKRLLAYSSIAHAGYMLLAILSIPKAPMVAQQSLFYYAMAYCGSSLLAFAILFIISRAINSETVDSFKGLYQRNPVLAFIITLTMLSLAGIPPLAGFFAKYYIFTAALQQGYTWLVIIAVLGSLIGVYYYFRVIIATFRTDESEITAVQVASPAKLFLLLTSLAILAIGIFPDFFIRLLS